MIWIQKCETCKYHDADEGICVNAESDYCTEWTDKEALCSAWEGDFTDDGI